MIITEGIRRAKRARESQMSALCRRPPSSRLAGLRRVKRVKEMRWTDEIDFLDIFAMIIIKRLGRVANPIRYCLGVTSH